jgi:hypothetical protein
VAVDATAAYPNSFFSKFLVILASGIGHGRDRSKVCPHWAMIFF